MARPLEYNLRRGTEADLLFLTQMLLEAAFWRVPEPGLRPPGALDEPHIRRYVAGWGRAGDAAVIAEEVATGSGIGAAWYRLLRPPEQGYGFVDEETPEVSIAVAAGARGRGVGTALLESLAEVARSQGFAALSLSVEKDNPAHRLFARCGYAVVGELGNAWTMRRSIARSEEALAGQGKRLLRTFGGI